MARRTLTEARARRPRPRSFARRSPVGDSPADPDPLDQFDEDGLRGLVSAADGILHDGRPRASEAQARHWSRAIRRWLRSAAAEVTESLDRLDRQAVASSAWWHIRKASPADFTVASSAWARLERELAAVLRDLFGDVGADAFADVAQEVGIALDPNLREVLGPGLEDAIGQEVRLISESSRQDLVGAVDTAMQRGYGVDQLANGVKGDSFAGLRGIVDRWQADNPVNTTIDRATLIARTELANAYNLGTVDAYRASGLVEVVNVFDGASCGWTSHTDPELANGKRVSLDEAAAHPIAHPGCQRAFGAVIAGAPPKGAAGAQVVPQPITGPRRGNVPAVELNARAIQARVFRAAEDAEKGVSATMRALEAQGLGRLEGIAFRLKADGERTIDKILEDVAANKGSLVEASKVNDALRYTFIHEPGSYYSSVGRIHDELLAAGYSPVKWRDNWQSPLSHDVNTAWNTPSGARFELQFHTPESFYRKMVAGPNGLPPSHKVYEEYRTLADGPRKEELTELLKSIWEGTEVPTGSFKPPNVYTNL